MEIHIYRGFCGCWNNNEMLDDTIDQKEGLCELAMTSPVLVLV